MQSFLLTPHFSNSWGISLPCSGRERPNIRWKINHFSEEIGQTSPLSLRGGNGGDSPELEEELFANISRMLIFTPLFQPFKTIRVLMQFGYEPVPPYPVRGRGLIGSLMGGPESTSLYLPGIYGYTQGVVQKYGWGCLLAGLGPSLAQMIIDTLIETKVTREVERFLLELLGLDLENRPPGFDLKRILYSGLKANIIQTISLLNTYPFIVCGNLGILKCIKGEPSVWIWSLFREVWEEAGFGGFYSGLLAMLLYQFFNVWCEEIIVGFVVFLMHKADQPFERNTGFDFTLAHLLVTSFTYPFLLISNIMTVNKCRVGKKNKFEEIPMFPSWVSCFKHMYRVGDWFRGSSVLQRRFVSLV